MFPGMNPQNFDMASLMNALNDPAIKEMAEKIANDPSFSGLSEQLKSSMEGMGAEATATGAPVMPNPENFDPAQYMQAMSGMFQNENFMKMAEQLGQAIISSDPGMQKMMSTMQSPDYKNKVEGALKGLKDDPELGKVFEELESGGPAAMMKYWNDPNVLQRMGQAMGDVFGELEGGPLAEGDEEEEEDDDVAQDLHGAASSGDVVLLKELLEAGADVDQQDDEGRTALHFAAGYGEIESAQALIAAGAKLNLPDNNQNTALHYAAGYGQADSVKLLLEKGADKSPKNGDDKTALEVAEMNEQEAVVALLRA